MRFLCRSGAGLSGALAASLLSTLLYAATNSPPPSSEAGLRQSASDSYYWKVSAAGSTAQLVTLFCHACYGHEDSMRETPLLAVLRDTLGTASPESDRVSYIWLLSAPHIGVGQRIFSAIPFFYWRIGSGAHPLTAHDLAPQASFTAPLDPMISGVTRQIVQWTAFDPLTSWVRAGSRSYQANASDYGRFELEQTLSLMRHAPASGSADGLTQQQIDTVVARLELRKTFLGGIADSRQAIRFAEESGYEAERVRSRNWEMLRLCAEKTGLLFEPTDLGDAHGQYALLWFPVSAARPVTGSSVKSVYKLLNMQNPWNDDRLKNWDGLTVKRSIDDDGRLLPDGQTGTGEVELIPLGLYSLNYPKLPLLLIDFRDRLRIRRHEMTQRSINQITAGVIGLSRITNWYYFVGAMAYNFVTGRHGSAVNQADRLDCYSQFRVQLALDHSLDPKLHNLVERRAESLTVNPLGAEAAQAARTAQVRYQMLLAGITNTSTDRQSSLLARLDRDRRAELATYGQSLKSNAGQQLLHFVSAGLYTQRSAKNDGNLSMLDEERRLEYHLDYLDMVTRNGTQPEVAFGSDSIKASLLAVGSLTGSLLDAVPAPRVRAHAIATVQRVADLSRDEDILAGCRHAMLALNGMPQPAPAIAESIVPHSSPLSGSK